MTRYIVDSYAWVEYFKASDKGLEVKNIIEDQKNEIFVPQVVISEVVSSIKRQKMDPAEAAKTMFSLSSIIDATKEDCILVGLLHADMRKTIKDFGLGDSFVLFSAQKMNAKILTGDPHFKHIKEAVMI